MMKACGYSPEGQGCLRGGFSGQEIKPSIQYNLICKLYFEAVSEVIEGAMSLCLLVLCSQP